MARLISSRPACGVDFSLFTHAHSQVIHQFSDTCPHHSLGEREGQVHVKGIPCDAIVYSGGTVTKSVAVAATTRSVTMSVAIIVSTRTAACTSACLSTALSAGYSHKPESKSGTASKHDEFHQRKEVVFCSRCSVSGPFPASTIISLVIPRCGRYFQFACASREALLIDHCGRKTFQNHHQQPSASDCWPSPAPGSSADMAKPSSADWPKGAPLVTPLGLMSGSW